MYVGRFCTEFLERAACLDVQYKHSMHYWHCGVMDSKQAAVQGHFVLFSFPGKVGSVLVTIAAGANFFLYELTSSVVASVTTAKS
jgi:hypothetical protein